MARARESAIIDAPLERVFEYRLNLANLPQYNPDVVDVRPAASNSDGAKCFQFRVRLAPGIWWPTRLVVTEANKPNRIRFAIESIMNAEEVCTFEASGRATHIVFETEVATRGGPLRPLVEAAFVLPFLKWQLRRELRLMKKHLES